MAYLISGIIGYILGSLNPAHYLSQKSDIDLRKRGTGNLGATNTALILGKWFGVAVMLFDIGKACAAVILCRFLFPTDTAADLLSGSAAVIGHIFPWYLSFKGGKGLAAFAGLVLATDIRAFLALLLLGCIVILITDYACSIAISSALLFPVIAGIRHQSLLAFFITAAASVALLFRHIENYKRIRRGEEIRLRAFLKSRRQQKIPRGHEPRGK